MTPQPSLYADSSPVPPRSAPTGTQIQRIFWFSDELGNPDELDADLVELRCLELQRKFEWENALYDHAYRSMSRRSVAR
jgi:hypothetical protein